MGSSEEGSNPPLETHNEEINLETSLNGTHIVHGDADDHRNQNPVEEESAIVEKLYNMELQSDAKEGGGGEGEFRNYPFRPNAADCAFFIRTGTCKYGPNCRFNHPPKGVSELVGEENGGTEQLNEVVSETQWKIECKYFSTPGGCKYGDACTYNHPSEETGMTHLELNFLGLPIRPMEKECTFYMRTGTCAYGAKCRFNHPDPSAANHPMPGNSLANGYSSRADNGFPKTNGTINYSNGFQGTLPNVMDSRNSAPYASNMGSNYHVMPPNHGWNQNQVTVSLPANKPALPHQIVDLSKKHDPSTNYERLMQIEEFPERPGQPDCDYFMKTGDCKYRSACRYNHPMSRSSKLPLPPLSSKGHYSRSAKMPPAETMDLRNSYSGNARNNGMHFDNNQKMNNGGYPERPGQPECEYFMKTGSCKFNSACRYHHPRNHVPESSPCALSDKGLPLRPGTKICRNYEHQGTCQYGIRCLFHHPDNVYAQVAAPDDHKNSSTSAAVSIPEHAFSDIVKPPSTSVAVSNFEPETNWDDGWVM